jgi:hypothetical protein
MNFKEIAEHIEDNGLTIGIRGLCQDEKYKAGDTVRESYEWNFEIDCSTYDIDGEEGAKTGGTSCIRIGSDMDDIEKLAEKIEQSFEMADGYAEHGAGYALIASKYVNSDGTFDEDETRLIDAKVIALLDENFKMIESI